MKLNRFIQYFLRAQSNEPENTVIFFMVESSDAKFTVQSLEFGIVKLGEVNAPHV